MRHELSVSIVVKNGASKIIECLSRLVGLADELVVVDTGSTDNTVDLVRKFSKTVRIPVIIEPVGSLFLDDEDNFDFGRAKAYGYSLATKEYVMWADVNDMLDDAKSARAKFDKATSMYSHVNIIMYTRTSRKFKFPRLRITKRETSKFCNPIHEYVVDSYPKKKFITFKNEFINFKKSRDAKRNLKSLIKLWKRVHSLRTAYYIATTYKDIKDKKNARLWYEHCLSEFPFWEFEETIVAADFLINEAFAFGKYDKVDELTMDMIENAPDRAEGYYYRHIYNLKKNNIELAIKCLSKILELPLPRNSRIGINQKAYNKKECAARIEELLRQVNYDKQKINTDARIYNSMAEAIDATQFMTTIY